MTDDPPLDELADDHDEDGWDVDRDGRMRDYAADDQAVTTEPYQPESS